MVTALVTVKGNEVGGKIITIQNYIFFGLFPITKKFNADSVQIHSFDIELESDKDAILMDSGHWWDFLLVILPEPKLTTKMYVLKEPDAKGRMKEAKVMPNAEESKLILNYDTKICND